MASSYANRCLRNFESAVMELAYMGAQPPEDHEAIERRYKQAKDNLRRQLK